MKVVFPLESKYSVEIIPPVDSVSLSSLVKDCWWLSLDLMLIPRVPHCCRLALSWLSAQPSGWVMSEKHKLKADLLITQNNVRDVVLLKRGLRSYSGRTLDLLCYFASCRSCHLLGESPFLLRFNPSFPSESPARLWHTVNVFHFQVQPVIHPMCEVCHFHHIYSNLLHKIPACLIRVNYFPGRQYWRWCLCALNEPCVGAEGCIKCLGRAPPEAAHTTFSQFCFRVCDSSSCTVLRC